MEQLPKEIIYRGYSGINVDKFNISQLGNLRAVFNNTFSKGYVDNVTDQMEYLKPLSLDQIRILAKEFYDNNLSVNNVQFLDPKKIVEQTAYISGSSTGKEFYDKVNSFLQTISPFDLPIKLTEGHSLSGLIAKPLIITPEYLLEENRKVYYSHIELGEQLTLLSVSTLVHELAHSQQEQNLGYAADYLNSEIISIFLEKVAALKLDESGELLKLCERVRFLDLYIRFQELSSGIKKEETDRIQDLVYIKSILVAGKLFDMYSRERKEKHKEGYFIDIQNVFDGKITVEDLIRQRNITIPQCQDDMLLRRHV